MCVQRWVKSPKKRQTFIVARRRVVHGKWLWKIKRENYEFWPIHFHTFMYEHIQSVVVYFVRHRAVSQGEVISKWMNGMHILTYFQFDQLMQLYFISFYA